MKNKILAILALGMLAGPMAANAVPTTGTYDLTLTGATSGSGWFSFDAVTGLVSGFSMTIGTIAVTNSDFGYWSTAPEFNTCWVEWATTAPGTTCIASPTLGGFGSLFGGTNIYYDWDSYNAFTVAIFGDGGSVVEGVFSATLRETSVPEPSTFALLGLGLMGLGFSRRRKAA